MTNTDTDTDTDDVTGSEIADTTDTEARRFAQLAGWSGLAAAVAYIATIVTASVFNTVETYDGPDDIVRYLNDVADNRGPSIVYGIAGIAMALLFVPFGVAVGRALRRTALAQIGTLAMVVGLVCLIPAYAISIVQGTALASAATEATAAEPAALYAATEFGAAMLVIFFTVGSILTLCVAPLVWGFEARRTGVFSPRLNVIGIAVGVSGLVWFVWFLETPLLLILMLVNALASLVYFIGLAMRLRRV